MILYILNLSGTILTDAWIFTFATAAIILLLAIVADLFAGQNGNLVQNHKEPNVTLSFKIHFCF